MTDLLNLAKECGAAVESWMTNPPKPAMVHITPEQLAALESRIRQDEREQAAAKADAWSEPSIARLAAGELTAQELRTAQAVARGIAAAIRASQPIRKEATK